MPRLSRISFLRYQTDIMTPKTTIQLSRHEGSHRIETLLLPMESGLAPSFAGAAWTLTHREVQSAPGVTRHVLRAEVTSGPAIAASFGLTLVCENWSEEVFVFVPGAIYAGNRFVVRPQPYPPMPLPRKPGEGDPRPQISDIERLTLGPGPSRFEVLSRDTATPCFGSWDPRTRRAWLAFIPPEILGHPLGIELEENGDRTAAEWRISWPGLRHERMYRMCVRDNPSDWAAPDWPAGQVAELTVELHAWECPDFAAFYERFFTLREATPATAWHSPRRPLPPAPPFSEVFRIIEDKYNRENWVETRGYYSVGLRQNAFQDWQMGWVGGMLATLPLIACGTPKSRSRARRNFDFVFPNGQAPSGFFYAMGTGFGGTTPYGTWSQAGAPYPDPGPEGVWLGDHSQRPTEPWHLVRKSADGLYFMLRQIRLLQTADEPIPAAWPDGLRRCAEALVETFRSEGEWGQFVNQDTGAVIVAGSFAAALAPGALLLAADFFGTSEFREVAVAAGEFFWNKFLADGFTNGGPAEAVQCPDSESAFLLIESFVLLAEHTGDPVWWQRATTAAAHAASWVFSFDYQFPSDSTFGRLGFTSAGTMWASQQNKCGVPGICTLSGHGLLRLYRATGDARVMRLLQDIARSLPQFLSTAERPIPVGFSYDPPVPPGQVQPPGWICERVNTTDWNDEGDRGDRIGEIQSYSCWCEVAALLTAAELPGVYWETDADRVWVLDQIEARIEGGALLLLNPWNRPATVTMLAESASARILLLGPNLHTGYRTVTVPAAGRITLTPTP
jgi:hypothetical protein